MSFALVPSEVQPLGGLMVAPPSLAKMQIKRSPGSTVAGSATACAVVSVANDDGVIDRTTGNAPDGGGGGGGGASPDVGRMPIVTATHGCEKSLRKIGGSSLATAFALRADAVEERPTRPPDSSYRPSV